MSNLSRRSFLKGAGVAAGAAIVGASPLSAAAATEQSPELVAHPSTLPAEPLVAYVRDARTFEVTILVGTDEVTYRDPALAKRLLNAAPRPGHAPKEVA
jgi:anaerobic selenocysteine-containing dehydrogenase